MHDGDDGCLHRDRALRSRPHRRDGPRVQPGERRPLPLRARGRSGLRRARHGVDDAARDGALRWRGERSRGRRRGARVAARGRLPSLTGQGARRRRLRAVGLAWHPHGVGFRLRRAGRRSGRSGAAAVARRHPRRSGPCRGSAADCGLRPDSRGLPQPDGEREGTTGAFVHAPPARCCAPLAHGARHVRGGDLVVHAEASTRRSSATRPMRWCLRTRSTPSSMPCVPRSCPI